jgi:hypothetical protein
VPNDWPKRGKVGLYDRDQSVVPQQLPADADLPVARSRLSWRLGRRRVDPPSPTTYRRMTRGC